MTSPVLSGGTVSPTSGYTSATFTYSANYTDFENEPPSSITVSIDGSASVNMTAKLVGQDGVFTNGEIYEYTITGTNLGVGTHTFRFAASDGTDNAIGDPDSHSGPTLSSPPAPTPPGGGGGGGGGGGAGLTTLLGSRSEQGIFTENVTAVSGDKKVKLFVSKGTIGKNQVGSLLNYIWIREKEDRPAPPLDAKVIGLVYDISPDGAIFNPTVALSFKYDVSRIPQGINERNLVIATWDALVSQWIYLESTVQLETHTISTNIGHLSVYTVMARTRPASFTIADLSVIPGELTLGESASISALITNVGDLAGSYELSLKIGGVEAQTTAVTLDGGSNETVSFTINPDNAGEHKVSIGDLLGTLKVEMPKPQSSPALVPAMVSAPASCTVSDLSVTPGEAKPSEQVTISAVVTNSGGSEGSCIVVLKINDIVDSKKEVSVGVGKNETVTFTVSKDTAGIYTVKIDDEVGQFVVIASPSTNWGLISGIFIIASGIIVAGILVYVWKKRGVLY